MVVSFWIKPKQYFHETGSQLLDRPTQMQNLATFINMPNVHIYWLAANYGGLLSGNVAGRISTKKVSPQTLNSPMGGMQF